MPMPIAVSLRERAVAAYEAGEGTYVEVASRFDVGRRPLQRWVKRMRDTGSLEPSPRGGGWRSPVDTAVLEALIVRDPSLTTLELTAAYNRKVPRKHRVHRSSVLRALRRAGYVFKKNAFVRPNSTDRMSSVSAEISSAS